MSIICSADSENWFYSEPAKVTKLMLHTDGTTQWRIGLAAPTVDA